MPKVPQLQAKLAKALKRERAARGWTQEQAAEASEMYRRHYQKLEEGSVNATLRTLERLSKAFKVSASELLE